MAADGERAIRPEERSMDDNDHRGDENENEATENTPLLPTSASSAPDRSQPHHEQSASSLLTSLSNNGNNASKSTNPLRRRWPSVLALFLLCIAAVLILVFAFLTPSLVTQYASEATVFTPTSLSVAGFTASGVQARVQGEFRMDASRVQRTSVRNFGRFGTWVAREVESGESVVQVSLPEYGGVVLGTATVPAVKISVRNGRTTEVDFLSEVRPGAKEGLRRIADDWIAGRLGRLRILGKAAVLVKSGILSLGEQLMQQELVFAQDDVPGVPAYDILRLNVRDEGKGMAADVQLKVQNEYPVDFDVPPLGFQILVDNCQKGDPYILLGSAVTEQIHVRPKEDVEVDVTGAVREVPTLLTQDCPDSDKSPLDVLLRNYMNGRENTIYVRGSKAPDSDTPDWVTDLMAGIVVPVPLPGKTMGHLIKSFSLADTHFSLPDPFAEPDTPESNPRISAQVKALVALPDEMNFNVFANQVRADATVFYKGKKLGNLDLNKWQAANSTRIDDIEDGGAGLMVESHVQEAPLIITDDNVFSDVISDMVFAGKGVTLHIKADVDVQVSTALGELKIRGIPAEGEVPVQPISAPKAPDGGDDSGNITDSLHPEIGDLQIIDTTRSGLTISALLNITNPTVYSATVPYADIHILCNGSLLGHATVRDLAIAPGENTNLFVEASYDPLMTGGPDAQATGRELFSQYISGANTTLTLQTHNSSIPHQPLLNRALSRFQIDLPTPRLPSPPSNPNKPPPESPDDPSDTAPHFLDDATMHLLTSSATLTLLSPLRHSTLYLTSINATAFYHGSAVGHIDYDEPFAVPPVTDKGEGSVTPRLPVEWRVGEAGFEAVKGALGGGLKLEARAEVGVGIGRWKERVWFVGKGLGARVRL